MGWVGVGMAWDGMMLEWIGLGLGCRGSDIDGLGWHAVEVGQSGVGTGLGWAVDGLG